MFKKILLFLLGIVLSIALLVFVTIFTSQRGIGMDDSEAEANGDEVVTAAITDLPQSDTADEPESVSQIAITTTVDRPDIHGFLSRVEYNNNVAYLLGSMHLGRSNWFPLNPIVEEAMARSDVFAIESNFQFLSILDDFLSILDGDFDFDDMSARATLVYLEAMMELVVIVAMVEEMWLLPDDMTLEDVLSPRGFENLMEMLETYPNVTYEDIYFLTPIAALEIITADFDEYVNIYFDYSVDMYTINFAIAHNKPVIGLNDVFYEVELLFYRPLESQLELFDNVQDRDTALNEYIEGINALTEAYETQDAERIRRILMDAFQDIGDIDYDVFLYRTDIYGNEILRLLRETEEPTTFFVTVGAGHILYGHLFSVLETNGLEIVELWR